ncbi:MAG: lysophospholipid acyltransferase family protein [Bacilli bacterium]|jgi:1-acyl-sn-glycerol-3-phosphate acyltransferase
MFSALFRFLVKVTSYPVALLFFKTKTYYESSKKESKIGRGPAIIMSNHTSAYDFIMLIFKFPFRKLRFLIGELVYKNKFNAWICNRFLCIKADKTSGDMRYMNEAVKTLNKGGIVGTFPEGHMIHDGKIDTFKPSVVYLALATGAPIIPVYTNGRYSFKHRTRINIGKKIYLRDYCSNLNPSPEEVEALCHMLNSKVKELQKQERLFEQYHTQNIIDFKWFVLDLVKLSSLFIIPKIYIVFPTKKHYVQGASHKLLHIHGRGIIMSNHSSFIDPIMMHIYYYKRRIRIVAAEELFYQTPPITRWFLKKIDCIEYRRISQNNVDIKMFGECANVLRANGIVGIFPEGHIEQEKDMMEFQGGVVLMALVSDSLIYPYYLVDQYRAFKMQHVIFGPPINLKDYYEKGTPIDVNLVNRLTIIVSKKMAELKDEGVKLLSRPKKH